VNGSLLDLRFRGGAHVESWYLNAAEPGGRRAIWMKASVFSRPRSADPRVAPVPPVAEAWAIAFDRERGHVVTKTTVPFERARFAKGMLDVEVDGCELSLGRARGALASGGRTIEWDLEVGSERASPIVHLPHPAMYESSLPTTKHVTPLADGRVRGRVRVQRSPGAEVEAWDVASWPSMIGHRWGRTHAHLYAWAHCNAWDDASDLVFEGVSARVRMGPLLSPMGTAVFVRFEGERFDLNSRSVLGKNRGNISLRRWEATAEGRSGIRVHAELAAETDDLVGLHHANPGGSMTYCLDTKLARARVEVKLPSGRSFVATSRTAALELGTRDPAHGVRMYV
jgi:hypothetical protein